MEDFFKVRDADFVPAFRAYVFWGIGWDIHLSIALAVGKAGEGHSNLLNEALSCGTPAIISNIHGLAEHNDYDRKLIIKDPSSAYEIAEVIAYANSINKEEYVAISNKARNYASCCLSENKEAEYLYQLYRST